METTIYQRKTYNNKNNFTGEKNMYYSIIVSNNFLLQRIIIIIIINQMELIQSVHLIV